MSEVPTFRRVFTRGNARASDRAEMAARMHHLTKRRGWGALSTCLFALMLLGIALCLAVIEANSLPPIVLG